MCFVEGVFTSCHPPKTVLNLLPLSLISKEVWSITYCLVVMADFSHPILCNLMTLERIIISFF